MFPRTFLAAALVVVSLLPFGCVNPSGPIFEEPVAQQPVYTQPSDPVSPRVKGTSDDAEHDVWPAMAQRGKLIPKPSEVRWVGPPEEPIDASFAVSGPGPAPSTTDRGVTFASDSRLVPADRAIERPIQKPTKDSIASETQHMPVPSASSSQAGTADNATKVAVDSANPILERAPLAITKPSTMPTVASIAANSAVDLSGPRPLPAVRVPAAAKPAAPKPAAPIVVPEEPNSDLQATKWLPTRPANLVSFESLLKQLPAEAQPLPNFGWDEFAISKSHNWIKDQLAGVELQVTVELLDVKLIRIRDPRDPDQTDGWELSLTTGPERFRAFDLYSFHWPATWKQDISGRRWRGGEVQFAVTEDFAKEARRWRVGDTVVLSGRVEDIYVEGGSTNLGQPCGRFTTIFHDIHVEKLPQGSRP